MKCSKCKRSYASLKGLKRHKNSPACEKACKVTKFQCEFCDKYFSYRSGLSRHKNLHCLKALEYRELKRIKYVQSMSGETRQKISIKPKSISITVSSNDSIEKHITEPSVPIIKKKKNQIHTEIGTIADDILDVLTKKIGDVAAIDLLLTSFMSKNYVKIINSAYLDGKSSDNYPMACSGGNHFRYIDSEYNLVDDATGEKLINTIINNIQNAALIASNKLIRKYMGQNKVGDLFEVYDLGHIQKGVCDMFKEIAKKKLKKLLATRVLNPNHQFFGGVLDFYDLQQKYKKQFK
jgi:hypothetical protein